MTINPLRAIALFKFAKATLLMVTAYAALKLADPGAVEQVKTWAVALPLEFEQALTQRLLGWISGLSPARVQTLGFGTLAYAGLFTIEGLGLWHQRRWAEWLTVIASASLVPLELWELLRAPRVSILLVLAANIAIVSYLIVHLVRVKRAD